ncbi:DUF262 domain-containing protein [Bacillus gaemokensis]|uniref:GmrSD restriction endonucleases N-terminal domain-containing protein n=1 Tax=Bacillus gaemokensis TaxID=574375 RepID=A0A073KNA7_9BACI|nr:DUF262 domain-containing protein [Bacillus gaemokensis]KEK23863.1 hypothetical protein BAGA_05310 [Bacillus gaemokensis]KYG38103.1 hypothetical protein AZF08_20345 [Bacillus gaemokensis]
MKKSSVNWMVKQFMGMVNKGTISFDYPIQRAGGQWDLMQKSLLIHSLAGDYPVPALYSLIEKQMMEVKGKEKEVSVYLILDGKQRLTNISGFLNDEYALHEETPSVEIDDEEYVLAGKHFSELDEEVQDKINSFSLQIYKFDEVTDEEIEDMFYRLNNGTPLSKQQKAKAKMGNAWAGKIKELVNHNMMTEKASFTELQLRKADNETALLQTMMLIDDNYEWKSISSNDVFDYAQSFKNDDSKDAIIEKIVATMDYLDKAFDGKESVLLKKVHFPMTMLTAMKAMEMDIHHLRFSDWKEEFKKALKHKSEIRTNYKNYGGAGSVKKEKTNGRINAMQEHLNAYFEKFQPTKAEQLKEEQAEQPIA